MSGRKILRQAQMEYFMWLSNPRMAISLVLLVLIHSLVIQPLHQAARDMGQPIHLLEPLAALANSPLILLLLPIGFIWFVLQLPLQVLLGVHNVQVFIIVMIPLIFILAAAADVIKYLPQFIVL